MEAFQLGSTLAMIAAIVLMVLGLVCAVIPSLPGPLILWGGMLVWAWADGFQRVGWGVLVVLLVIAIAAMAIDFLITLYLSRRAGASWKAIGGGIVGGLIGGLLLSGVPPILGSIIGAIGGVIIGMWSVEYFEKRDNQAAWRAVRGYLTSVAVSAAVELMLVLGMVGIFVWRVLA